MELSIKQVADRLNVCTRTIFRWIENGTLPATKYGPKTIRVSEQDLADFRAKFRTQAESK